jgi:hypothetical protein
MEKMANERLAETSASDGGIREEAVGGAGSFEIAEFASVLIGNQQTASIAPRSKKVFLSETTGSVTQIALTIDISFMEVGDTLELIDTRQNGGYALSFAYRGLSGGQFGTSKAFRGFLDLASPSLAIFNGMAAAQGMLIPLN